MGLQVCDMLDVGEISVSPVAGTGGSRNPEYDLQALRASQILSPSSCVHRVQFEAEFPDPKLASLSCILRGQLMAHDLDLLNHAFASIEINNGVTAKRLVIPVSCVRQEFDSTGLGDVPIQTMVQRPPVLLDVFMPHALTAVLFSCDVCWTTNGYLCAAAPSAQCSRRTLSKWFVAYPPVQTLAVFSRQTPGKRRGKPKATRALAPVALPVNYTPLYQKKCSSIGGCRGIFLDGCLAPMLICPRGCDGRPGDRERRSGGCEPR